MDVISFCIYMFDNLKVFSLPDSLSVWLKVCVYHVCLSVHMSGSLCIFCLFSVSEIMNVISFCMYVFDN